MNLKEYLLALEADDITDEAQKEANKINDGQSTDNDADDGSNDKEDLGKTDDIFGIKKHKENKNSSTDDDSTNTQNDSNNEDNTDPNLDNNDSDSENNASDELDNSESSEPEDDESKDTSALPFYDKNKLRDNMVLLHDMLDANIKIISNLLSHINDNDSTKICEIVSRNLMYSKEVLYKILTKDMNSKSYEELLKDYLTIKRIYDINYEILYKHFDNKSVITKKKNTKK